MKTTFTLKTIFQYRYFLMILFISGAVNAQSYMEIPASDKVPAVILSYDTPPILVVAEDQNVTNPQPLTKSSANTNSLAITIIESQSANSGHTMDVNWLNVATLMGNSAVIEPQTTLDNTDIFDFTDILVISSGVIDIPLSRRAIIQQFIEQGGPVYIQSEYLSSYQANETFQQIVTNLGGSFSWAETVSGDLIPMNIFGTISNTPNLVPSLSYFWYGCVGSGDATIEANMEYMGQNFGFIFTPPNSSHGVVMTNSDQDWARDATEKDFLMENILTYLSSMIQTDVKNNFASDIKSQLSQNYPNPVTAVTRIKYTVFEPGFVTIKVHNLLGMEIETLTSGYQTIGDHYTFFEKGNLPEGQYFYQMKFEDEIIGTKKMILSK
jgi:hypothetical protein